MTEQQKKLCPEDYRRLRESALRAGESIGNVTRYRGR